MNSPALQARAAEFGLTSPVGELRKQTDAFVSRMANVEAQMSQVREQPDARLAEVRQLRRRPGAASLSARTPARARPRSPTRAR